MDSSYTLPELSLLSPSPSRDVDTTSGGSANGSSVGAGGSTRDGSTSSRRVERGGSSGARAVSAGIGGSTVTSLNSGGGSVLREKTNAGNETRWALFCLRRNTRPTSRSIRVTAAVIGAIMAATGTDLFPVTELAGNTVGRTVWTVAVTGTEVDDPDIWVGEKVTIAVVVVNEEVTSRLDAVGVENFEVLGT